MTPKFIMAAGFLFLALLSELTAFGKPTIFYGGTILTLDPAAPEVEAIVVDQGKIVALGQAAKLKKAFPNLIDQDLKSRTLLPGFVDSHAHVKELGMDQLIADVSGSQTVAEMITAVRKFYPNPKPGQWLLAQGWDEGVWGSRGYPDRKELDLAFPQNPVKLASLHGFAGFYNGQALKISGINSKSPNPEAGTILRRQDGSPTGVMLTLAQGLVDQHVPKFSPSDEEKALLLVLNQMAAHGVTSVHEAGISQQELGLWQKLAAEGQLPIRVYGLLDGNNGTLVSNWVKGGPYQSKDGFLTIRGFKVFYDGSLGSRTALLSKPYEDQPQQHKMAERISLEQINQLAKVVSPKGFQLAIHTIGDQANRNIIELYRKIKASYPNQDLRWRLEHAQVLYPKAYSEIAKLGLIASMQPSHAVGDSKWAEDRLGPRRIKHSYAWKSILAAGGKLTFNSDLPGEPWYPVQTLYFAASRQDLDGNPKSGWYPEQALSISESLNAMTVAGAFSEFAEDRSGRLKQGFAADFVILDRNPLTTSKSSLKDLKVNETWVAGKRIYPRGKLAH